MDLNIYKISYIKDYIEYRIGYIKYYIGNIVYRIEDDIVNKSIRSIKIILKIEHGKIKILS